MDRTSRLKNKRRLKRFMTDRQTSDSNDKHQIQDVDINQNVQTSASRESPPTRQRIFPDHTIKLIWVLTVVARVYLVQLPDSHWVLHPDEVFQSTEVAHSLVYGYGFRPYEYLPPPDPNTTSAVERQEALTGMYSLRSFIVPRLYATVLYAAHKAAVNINPYHACRLFHAVVAAHLPMAVYLFVLAALDSSHEPSSRDLAALAANRDPANRDPATLAAALVALSVPLAVFGTHALVNSLLAPLVFVALAQLISHVNRTPTDQQRRSAQCDRCDYQIHLDNVDRSNSKTEQEMVICANTTMESHTNGDISEGIKGRFGKLRKICSFVGSYVTLPFRDKFDWKHILSPIRRLMTGFCIGLLVYARIDLVLLISSVCLPFVILTVYRTDFRIVAHVMCHILFGAIFGMVYGGWGDKMAYGKWFLSPYQWLTFNVRKEMSSILFGSQDGSFYVESLMSLDPFYLSLICVTCHVLVWTPDPAHKERKSCLRAARLLTGVTLVLLCVYSSQKHKELRFIHNLIVLYDIILAICIYTVVSFLNHLVLKRIIVLILLIGCSGNLYLNFPAQSRGNEDWAYLRKWDTNHVNDCLEFVGQQPDATGVFLDRTIHATGGYSILHKDIPMFTLIHHEFHEYGIDVRLKIGETAWLGNRPLSLVKLSKLSNFVAAENSPLLLKYLLEDLSYNYLVVRRDRPVISLGFSEVYSSGTMRVLRRTRDPAVEGQLRRVAASIPLGKNATVLEYEGSWLHTFELYSQAAERLEFALTMGRPTVRTLQLLAVCYEALGRRGRSQEMVDTCHRRFGDRCSQQQPRVVLHQQYELDFGSTT